MGLAMMDVRARLALPATCLELFPAPGASRGAGTFIPALARQTNNYQKHVPAINFARPHPFAAGLFGPRRLCRRR